MTNRKKVLCMYWAKPCLSRMEIYGSVMIHCRTSLEIPEVFDAVMDTRHGEHMGYSERYDRWRLDCYRTEDGKQHF